MRKLLLLIFLLACGASFLPTSPVLHIPTRGDVISGVQEVEAAVRVRGYYRKDGTYVQPYYRSNPDGNPYNNWSFPGNVNPYTGKVAPGNPDTYLKNYYGNTSSGSSYSIPSYLTPTTISVPANAYTVGSTWYCNTGYKQVGNTCEKVVCVANAYVGYDNKCYCNSGYQVVNGQCEKL